MVDRALLLLLVGDQGVVAVEEEHPEVLGLAVAEARGAVVQHRLPGADDRPADHRFAQRAHAECLDQLERVDHPVADARHLLQRPLFGAEHGADGAEALDQPLGERLDVAPGQRLAEQQLQQLVVGQSVRARLVEALAQPLAMAVKMGLVSHRNGALSNRRAAW